MVEPDAVLVVERTRRTAAVQLYMQHYLLNLFSYSITDLLSPGAVKNLGFKEIFYRFLRFFRFWGFNV